jgi:hypothetical protein
MSLRIVVITFNGSLGRRVVLIPKLSDSKIDGCQSLCLENLKVLVDWKQNNNAPISYWKDIMMPGMPF